MPWQLKLRDGRSRTSKVLLITSEDNIERESEPLTENSTYWWQLTGTIEDPFIVALVVNGLALSRDISAFDEVWFRWDLGFSAGFADVELIHGRRTPWSSRLVIDPATAKLVRQDFRLMLRDIIEDTRSLATTSGLRERLSRGSYSLPIANLEFILESAPRLHALVHELDRTQRRKLSPDRTLTPLRDARGITTKQWAVSRRHGVPVDSVAMRSLPPQLLELASGGVLPTRIEQTRTRPKSALREHAEILGFLHSLIAQLRRSMRTLASGEQRPGELVLHSRCRRVVRQITSLSELSVFQGLSPERGPWKHSHLYKRAEPFRSLFRLYRDIRSGVSGVGGDYSSVPLQETFRLYETWVCLRLARAAAAIDPQLDASSMFTDDPERNQLTLSLQATAIEFCGRTLKFKPVFQEVWKTKDGIGSYSRQMIPDIVLELQTTSYARSIVVLDAKYRVESQLNDAIASIHMYKDSLIQESRESAVEVTNKDKLLVVSGFVVVPNSPASMNDSNDWRSEKMPVVLFREGYRDRFNLGALLLRPGTAVRDVADTLVGLLSAGEDQTKRNVN